MNLAGSRVWPVMRIFLVGLFLFAGFGAYAKGVRKGAKDKGGSTVGTAFFSLVLIILPLIFVVYITRKSAVKNGNGNANKAP